MTNDAYPNRNEWQPGETARFEYSLGPNATSAIWQELGHRSGQMVTVLCQNEGETLAPATLAQRGEEGCPFTYDVRFPDGHVGSAFEDELLDPDYKGDA